MFVTKLYETKLQEEITLITIHATKKEAIRYATFWCGTSGKYEIVNNKDMFISGKI